MSTLHHHLSWAQSFELSTSTTLICAFQIAHHVATANSLSTRLVVCSRCISRQSSHQSPKALRRANKPSFGLELRAAFSHINYIFNSSLNSSSTSLQSSTSTFKFFDNSSTRFTSITRVTQACPTLFRSLRLRAPAEARAAFRLHILFNTPTFNKIRLHHE